MRKYILPLFVTAAIFTACSNENSTNTPTTTADTATQATTDTTTSTTTLPQSSQDSINIVTVEFESLDGLMITADKGGVPENEYWILLCHQAGFSRGEYIETACEFNELGFNTLAIDQRSGKTANDIPNETAKRATEAGLPTNFTDAEQDIRAALNYVYELSGGKPVIICGSSYSASLVLKIGTHNEKVRAILSFSPSEYYKDESVKAWATAVDKPLFVTSSKSESGGVTNLTEHTSDDFLFHFTPEQEGVHGSRALWLSQNNNVEYWDPMSFFLSNLVMEDAGL